MDKKLRVIQATHPINQQIFRAMATPQELIKANKNTSQMQCTTCFTTRHKLLTCQKCKSVWYCSKECQKKDWPRHKAWCTASERPKGIKKIIESVCCNITLVTILQACAALDLDLINDTKKEIGFKVPFMIRVDIAIEPSDMESFFNLFLTTTPMPEKLEGMLQFNHFHSHIPGRSGFIPLTPMRDNMWHNCRESLDNDPVHRNNALGLVEYVNNGSDFSLTNPLSITPGALKLATHKEPFKMFSALMNKTFEKPMTVATCMEFMNTHIRSDKKNELKLRVEMTDTDKAIVRSARTKTGHSSTTVDLDPVILLRQKMERESIYANLTDIAASL